MGMKILKKDFDKMLEILESSGKSSEVEMKIDSVDSAKKDGKNINHFQFQNCLLYISSIFSSSDNRVDRQNEKEMRKKNIVLDITSPALDDVRVYLTGMENILYYCRTKTFRKDSLLKSVKATRKPRAIDRVHIREYDVTFKSTTEDEITDITELKTILSKLESSPRKHFRVKQRYSFISSPSENEGGNLRFDLTVVQQSHGENLGDLARAVGRMKKKYEIEIEVLDPVKIADKKKSLMAMINYMSEILQVLDNVEYLMGHSEAAAKKKEYITLVFDKLGVNEANRSQFFAGPQPVTLEKKHILRTEGESVNINDNYTVSLKADGERHLIYIDDEGSIFVLNNRLVMKDTGLSSPKLNNSLFDGELVTPRINDGTQHILLFDSYYINGECIAYLPLMQTIQTMKRKPDKKKISNASKTEKAKEDKDKKDNKDKNEKNLSISGFSTRYEALEAFEGSMNEYDTKGSKDSKRYSIKVKEFNYPSKQSGLANIFECAYNMLKKAEFVNFETDGLIFTPAILPVGHTKKHGKDEDQFDASSYDPSSLSGTWTSVLKWKPPDENTIDFLVKETNDPLITINGQSHKTFGLYCGAFQSPFSSTTNLLINKQRLRQTDSYVPKLFNPITPVYRSNFKDEQEGKEQVDVRYAFIPVDEKGSTNAKNGDEIITNSIVEMFFDMETKHWRASRVRKDKTEKYKETGVISKTANDYDVATKSIWETIVNPITYRHITGEMQIRDDESKNKIMRILEDDTYYENKGHFREAHTQPMKTFHNHMVKNRSLISRLKNASVKRLLDPTFGQGGDLKKYSNAGITTVLGYDLSSNNIYAKRSGANSRLYNEFVKDDNNPKKSMKRGLPWKYVFLPLDFSIPLSKSIQKIEKGKKSKGREEGGEGKEGGDDDDLQLLLWGRKDTKTSVLVPFKNLATKPFDAVSIQFALHYFFGSRSALDACLDNISMTLADGGYFIGTCFDGQQVDDAFTNAVTNVLEGTKNNKVIWRINKKYEGRFDPKKADLGKKIGVYVETINDRENDEYLVGFDFLIAELKKRKIRLANSRECESLGLSRNKPMGGFQGLYDDMKLYAQTANSDDRWWIDESLQMSEAEKKLSFLYKWFVFRKDEEMPGMPGMKDK